MAREDLKGMTVNERLFTLGLEGKFRRAILFRRKKRAVAVLMQAEFSEEQATNTVNTIYESPRKYGFLF
ncbi:MAG: hypothetical protein ACPG4Q_10190 [Phycisphaeraceae bacterium]